MQRGEMMELQRGFTLIEFMVVVALISLAVSMTVVDFKEANDSRINAQAIADVRTVINTARLQYDPATGYSGITEAQVATSSAFPLRLCLNGNCAAGISLNNLGVQTYMMGANLNGFYFNLGPLTPAECVELGSKMIYHVDEIRLSGTRNSSTGISIYRTNVLATANIRGASHYFYYGGGSTAGVCRYTNNYMIFYVDVIS